MFATSPRDGVLYSRAFILSLLAPLLLLLGVVFVYPLFGVIVTSATAGDFPFEDYVIVLSDDLFWTTLIRTLSITAMVVGFSLALGYPLAAFIRSAPGKVQIVLLAMVVVPMWSSIIARTFAWFGIFRGSGPLNAFLGWFGIGPTNLLFSTPAVVIGMVHVMLPLLVLPIYVALRNYDESFTLASRSMGATATRTLIRVKLAILAPQIITGCAAIFILSMGFFISPALLGGPRNSMVSNLIYQQVRDRFDLARADALAVVLLLTTLLLFGLLLLLVRLARRR